jgi:L-iditol 2-dehydrogenase
MHAAVYKGQSVVSVEQVPIPEIAPGEMLVRVEACGICHTDLKKIEYNLLAPPRIYGHETAGVVVRAGREVSRFAPGDRVVVFHHIPCKNCFYCQRKLYAQCPVYKKVGVTAGFEPAGGGFSQYVRVMDWIVERGVEKIPDDVSFERASFVEPVNTCLKAVVQCAPQPGEVAVVIGQGPIGLLFTMLLQRTGATIVTTDTIAARRALSIRCGAQHAWHPRETSVEAEIRRFRARHRGAGHPFLPPRRTDSLICANLRNRARRDFRRGDLRGRAQFVRVLQRFRGFTERIRGIGLQRGLARGRAYLPPGAPG